MSPRSLRSVSTDIEARFVLAISISDRRPTLFVVREQAIARISDVHNSVAALAAKPPIRIILGDRQLGDRQWRAAR
jgi:hypothetical protein